MRGRMRGVTERKGRANERQEKSMKDGGEKGKCRTRMNVGKVNERQDEWSKGKERKDERVIGKVNEG
jgi:hypothetical protein